MQDSVILAKKVQGTDVRNTQGEDLGHIEDVAIDKSSGRIVYAILSFGGFLGLGDKHFALPWQILKYSAQAEAYILNLDKEILKRAPGFDESSAPNFSDRRWGEQISQYYGVEPYWLDDTTATGLGTTRTTDFGATGTRGTSL